MVNRESIVKLWRWFDSHFLLLAVGFLIAFVPLYPKIPLGEIIPGYIVRVRLEDILILGIFAWWLFQLARRKTQWKTPLSLSILLYLAVGLISNLLGVAITKTIPAELLHFGKSTLHWLRHIEYFSLFFVAYNAVKTRKQGMVLFQISAVTAIAIAIYGYGQRYWFWPVYSTMNREFSKGIRLYLSEFARVQSTFAGHYDLGAYLVIMMPIFLALYFGLAKREQWKDLLPGIWWKLTRALLVVAWIACLWLLAVSASRASFLAYLLSAGLVILLYTIRRSLWWGISRGTIVLFISLAVVLVIGELPSRFALLVDENKYPQIHRLYHGLNDVLKHPGKIIGLNPQKPEGGMTVEELERQLAEQGLTRSDTQPSASRPGDVREDIPEKEFDLDDPAATLAGELIRQGDKLIQQRTYSECSINRSLSLCIRFETLWPRAIKGFMNNPAFGSGYATLTKENVEQFTEAESTDNNFLRTLGENGALGFFFYYGAIGLSLWYSIQAFRKSRDPFITALVIGNFAGTAGLLLNATYLDVFVASKVAYTFWLFQGVTLALLVNEGVVGQKFAFERQTRQNDTQKLAKLLQSAEQKQQARSPEKGAYLSVQKRKLKSSKTKKTQRRN